MRYHRLLAFFLLFVPLSLLAQRGGRPDGLQNYERMLTPQLLLQVKVHGKRFYFRPSDLRKKQRSIVVLTDPATKTSHTYEGVVLDQLVQNVGTLESENLKISFGSRQSVTILGRELDVETKPMIVDSVDGKRLTGYAPYYFVAKSRHKALQPTADVSCIAIKSLQ
jgi:hypothetical protein